MLGAAAVQILAIAGTSSAEPILFLRFPYSIVGRFGVFFNHGSGIPHIVNYGPSLPLLVPRVTNLIEIGRT